MSTVSIDQMRSKLLTMEQVHQKLASTEPLTVDLINSDTQVAFGLTPDWAENIDAVSPTHVLNGIEMRVNGVEKVMTKEAALHAAASAGMNAAFLKKTPAHLVEPILNHHFSAGFEDKSLNLLSVDDVASAFTRSTVTSYSNVSLLESTLEGINDHYGEEVEVLADYKFGNSLTETEIHLILPNHQRVVTQSDLADVPNGSEDLWLAGVTLGNSLTGKKPTGLEGYMFRWWCTNGAITRMDGVESFSRRGNVEELAAYEWARTEVDNVLGGLEGSFDRVQALTHLSIQGNSVDILTEIFKRYGVPVSQRQQIMDNLLELENLTMYAVMNAITQVANDGEIRGTARRRLMQIGGDIPTSQFDTLKARVWAEGHTADQQADNPYAVHTIAH